MMFRSRGVAFALALIVVVGGASGCASEQMGGGSDSVSEPTFPPLVAPDDADPRAVELARASMEKMGGWEAWQATRFVRWRFFGRRLHFWDRHTGDIRIESPARDESPAQLVLMNIRTGEGRVWIGGEELTEPAELGEKLAWGKSVWINDSYWMFMPYKLLDPGVNLKYSGEQAMADGRMADVLDLTFDAGIGDTPENRYLVYLCKDSGIVEQWDFYSDAGDVEPQFKMPWVGWEQFGNIRLATSHGRELDWEIAVYDELPGSVFDNPEPVGI